MTYKIFFPDLDKWSKPKGSKANLQYLLDVFVRHEYKPEKDLQVFNIAGDDSFITGYPDPKIEGKELEAFKSLVIAQGLPANVMRFLPECKIQEGRKPL